MPSDTSSRHESGSSSRHGSSRHSSRRHGSSRTGHRPSSIYAPSRNGSRVFSESRESLGTPETSAPRSPVGLEEAGIRLFGEESGDNNGGGMFYRQSNNSRLSTRDKNRDTDKDTLRAPNDARSLRSSRSRGLASGGLYGLGGGGAASRFSLTDQFTSSRQEYEFDDADDASIYYTPASEAGFDEEEEDGYWDDGDIGGGMEDTIVLNPPPPPAIEVEPPESDAQSLKASDEKSIAPAPAPMPMKPMGGPRGPMRPRGPPLRDAYELFCISKRHEVDDGSWEDQVRRAFRRVMPLVHPDAQPDDEMRDLAGLYFNDVIKSYEVLVSAGKRVEYDADLVEASLLGDYDSLLEALNAERGWSGRNEITAVDAKCQHAAMRQMVHENGIHTSSDLTVRLDGRHRLGHGDPLLPRPLDLALGHAVSVPLSMTPLRALSFRAVASIPPQAARIQHELEKVMVKCLSGRPNPDPVLTVSASVHALLENSPLSSLAPLHFALLTSISPENLMNLATSGIEPGLSIGLQQEIPSTRNGLPPTLLSLEISPLTVPTKSFHFSHALKHNQLPQPLYISGSLTSTMGSMSPPHADLELHQPLPRVYGGGGAWFTCNSGDWGYEDGHRRIYTLFHRLQRFAQSRRDHGGGIGDILSLVLGMPPRAEIGWTGCDIGNPGARPLVPCRKLGTLGQAGCTSHKGKYQLSASVGGLAGSGVSARYRTGIAHHPWLQRIRYSRRVGVELELATSSLMGPQVVGRSMFRLGKFANVGLEIGSGARGTLHLGLHWQRLGQRVSIPIVIGAGEGCRILSQLAFWGAITPVLVSHAVKAFKAWRLSRMEGLEGKEARRIAKDKKKNDEEWERIRIEELVEREQERRRVEADILSALLAPGTEARQARERKEKAGGGLIIQSAKFGLVADEKTGEWDMDEEVADVTVALAALVDGERGESLLRIPRGMKLERLLGFWDPCPGRRKTLVVRYSYRGQEETVFVKSGAGLMLGAAAD
ncbi:putative DnaJ domain-containing protein [Zalerion maritima]|uniref:DnaJ domain-containing protein n=1 Tax=Zalerion maritima TaxID=339359 RepID=A0AAD5RSW2_9PEZI|nr:putative DnaJ domain-containing protein [Zalerion maritima]